MTEVVSGTLLAVIPVGEGCDVIFAETDRVRHRIRLPYPVSPEHIGNDVRVVANRVKGVLEFNSTGFDVFDQGAFATFMSITRRKATKSLFERFGGVEERPTFRLAMSDRHLPDQVIERLERANGGITILTKPTEINDSEISSVVDLFRPLITDPFLFVAMPGDNPERLADQLPLCSRGMRQEFLRRLSAGHPGVAQDRDLADAIGLRNLFVIPSWGTVTRRMFSANITCLHGEFLPKRLVSLKGMKLMVAAHEMAHTVEHMHMREAAEATGYHAGHRLECFADAVSAAVGLKLGATPEDVEALALMRDASLVTGDPKYQTGATLRAALVRADQFRIMDMGRLLEFCAKVAEAAALSPDRLEMMRRSRELRGQFRIDAGPDTEMIADPRRCTAMFLAPNPRRSAMAEAMDAARAAAGQIMHLPRELRDPYVRQAALADYLECLREDADKLGPAVLEAEIRTLEAAEVAEDIGSAAWKLRTNQAIPLPPAECAIVKVTGEVIHSRIRKEFDEKAPSPPSLEDDEGPSVRP